jgi:hypothetical protein
MSLLSEAEPLRYDITKLYIEDVDAISIIDFMFVNDSFKLDIEMITHYGQPFGLYYLPIILMFNGVENITDVDSLIVFKFPNIESLLENLISLTDEDFSVGVTDRIENKNGFVLLNNTKPPSTKLKLSMQSVSFDKESGNITY